MNKLIKGALTMVLVGSVTFSVTNALFGDHTFKLLPQANDSTQAGEKLTADNINQAEKKGKDSTQKVADSMSQVENTVKVQPIKVAYNMNQAEKTVKVRTLPADVKDVQTTHSNHIFLSKTVLTSGNKNDKVNSAIQKNTTTSATSNTSRPKSSNNSTKPTNTSSKPSATNTATNSKNTTTGSTNKKTSTETAPTTSKTTTATTNHGQQVSQAAKERTANRKDLKENNGKKK